MKFDDDPWNDARYLIIRDVAEDAGYRVIRADEITTSGAVVDEVCRLFRESALVILDTTGDSLSVSYELGYCHGINRDPAQMILLRKGVGKDIPFNYKHFRFRCYRDLRHLRRLLQEWFGLLRPLSDGSYGYAFPFTIAPGAGIFGREVADTFLSAFESLSVSGRIEYYAGDSFVSGIEYVVCIGHRPSRKKDQLDLRDWQRIADHVQTHVNKRHAHVTLLREFCELGELQSFKHYYLYCGAAEFVGGKPVRTIKQLDEDSGNWSFFLESVVNKLAIPEAT